MIQSEASLTLAEFPRPMRFQKVVFACCGGAELPGEGWDIKQLVVVCPSVVRAPTRVLPESSRVSYVDALLGAGFRDTKLRRFNVSALNSTRKLIADITAIYPGVEMLSEDVVAQTTLRTLVDGFELDAGGPYLLCLDMIGDGPALFDWVINSRAILSGLGAVLMRVGIDALHEGSAVHRELLQICEEHGLTATSLASDAIVHSAWIFVDFGEVIRDSGECETEVGAPYLAAYSASQIAAMRDSRLASRNEYLDLKASLAERTDQLASVQLELQRTKTALKGSQAKLTALEANTVDIEEHLGTAKEQMGTLVNAVEKLSIAVDAEAAQTRATGDEIQATIEASLEKWIPQPEKGPKVQLEDQEKLQSRNTALSRENHNLSKAVAKSDALTKKAVVDLQDQIRRHEETARYARRLEAILSELAVHLPAESMVKESAPSRKKGKVSE